MNYRKIMGAMGFAAFGLGTVEHDPISEPQKSWESPTEKTIEHTTSQHAARIAHPSQETVEMKGEPHSFLDVITPENLNEESTELRKIFDSNPEVSEKYFSFVDQLSATSLPDGSGTHFIVPGTDFDITLRVGEEGGKSWTACEGLGCAEYGEMTIDGKTQLTQMGWRTELGVHTDSANAAIHNSGVIEDFQHLLVGYAQADHYGASNPLAETDTSSGDDTAGDTEGAE